MHNKTKKLNNGRFKKNLKKGFTLVELLVVISIIAMLLAIIMPALGKAKEKASQKVCMVNLKNIGQAMLMYSSDNRDYFPDPITLGGVYTAITATNKPPHNVSVYGFRARPGWKDPSDPRSLCERYGLAAVLGKSDYYGKSPKGAYLDGQSKVWVCPSITRFKIKLKDGNYISMGDLGNTYYFSSASKTVDTKVYARMPLKAARAGGNNSYWSQLDILVMDNYQKLPMTPGQPSGNNDTGKFSLDPKISPHPKRGNQDSLFYNQLCGDLSILWASAKK